MPTPFRRFQHLYLFRQEEEMVVHCPEGELLNYFQARQPTQAYHYGVVLAYKNYKDSLSGPQFELFMATNKAHEEFMHADYLSHCEERRGNHGML